MKIAIVTCFDQNCASYAKFTDELKKKYCERHGYSYFGFTGALDNYRTIHWSKITATLRVLKDGFDAVLWMDADAAPINHGIKIEDIISAHCDGKFDVMIAADVLGINTGVILVRNTPKALEWLSFVDTPEFHKRHCKDPFHEQDAISRELFQSGNGIVVAKPNESLGFNNYDNIYKPYKGNIPNEFKPWSWILHIPGYNDHYRAYRFGNIAANFGVPRCPVCGKPAKEFFRIPFDRWCDGPELPKEVKRLDREVSYHLCTNCEYVFAPEFMDWSPNDFREKIYNEEYEKYIDPGHVSERAEMNFQLVKNDLSKMGARHLDYGGGNGLLSELVEQRIHAESDNYDPFYGKVLGPHSKYSLITCFEVLEHVIAPRQIFSDFREWTVDGGFVITSTQVWDDPRNVGKFGNFHNWWYAAPRNGHISFYAWRTLEYLADQFGFELVKRASDFRQQAFRKI